MSNIVGSGVSGGGAAYDPALQADRSFQINADHLHFIPDEFDGINAANDDYYHYLDMSSYRRADLHLVLDAVGSAGTITVTMQGALEDTATGPEIPLDEWVDISTAAYGAASFATVAGAKTVHLASDTTQVTAGIKWLRIKVVVAGGTTDLSYEIFAKRLY